MQDFFDKKMIGPMASVIGLSEETMTKIVALFMMTAIVFSWFSIGSVVGTQERETITKSRYENV